MAVLFCYLPGSVRLKGYGFAPSLPLRKRFRVANQDEFFTHTQAAVVGRCNLVEWKLGIMWCTGPVSGTTTFIYCQFKGRKAGNQRIPCTSRLGYANAICFRNQEQRHRMYARMQWCSATGVAEKRRSPLYSKGRGNTFHQCVWKFPFSFVPAIVCKRCRRFEPMQLLFSGWFSICYYCL